MKYIDEIEINKIYAKIGERFVSDGSEIVNNLDLQNHYSLVPFEEIDLAFLGKEAIPPYDNPGFGKRVLSLHLDPLTDQSSRKPSTMKAQVDWMLDKINVSYSTSVFHPMCGPGLFAKYLYKHNLPYYFGVDINHFAITYARNLCEWPEGYIFKVGDLRKLYSINPIAFDIALLTYESLNAFPKYHAEQILLFLQKSIKRKGKVIAEIRIKQSRYETNSIGRKWQWCPNGSVFSPNCHLLLSEWGFLEHGNVFGHRFIVLSAQPKLVYKTFHSFVWLYSKNTIEKMFRIAGFKIKSFEKPFVQLETGTPETSNNMFVVAEKYVK